ncbi:MAG TPA: hypothetical protein VKC89_01895 [Patescibacteria group bacterium]|nr:hypothetical protein [Patescibacteria group bacterium]
MVKSDLINVSDKLEFKKLREKLSEANWDDEKIGFGLSFSAGLKILKKVFGDEWVNKNIGKQKTKSDIDWYFAIQNGSIPFRIIQLANYLFNLCERPGFDARIKTFKSIPLKSLMFELYAAFGIKEEIGLKFVKESGVMGKDYDFNIKTDGEIYNCEVEYVYDDPQKTLKTISNKLNHAKKQLPRNSNGIILLRAPNYLIDENKLQEIINGLFRNTSRVKYVFIFFEDTLDEIQLPLKVVTKRLPEYRNQAPSIEIFKPWDRRGYQNVGESLLPQNYLIL